MARADSRTDFSHRFHRAICSPLFFSVAGLLVLLVALEFFRPCFFLHDDNASWFCGAYVHDFRVLTETGRIAEVNFNQYGGEPFLEQGQTAVLYPPVYVAVALAKFVCGDARWTIEWLAAMHLVLGLLGFYFWLRQGGVTPVFAALGGLAWVLNPFVLIIAASWITVTFAATWLPWLFWALDRLYRQPTLRSAGFLGIIAALFFLQGYVQWVAYSFLALGFYAFFRFIARGALPRLAIVFYLGVAALIFLIFALPLLLPMLHAIDLSFARSKPISIVRALEYRVMRADLIRAQVFLFRPNYVFGISTAILFCPALLLFPTAIARFLTARAEIRQQLFPLVLLSLLALFFSSRWHFFLSLIPVMEKFRWPFKVFLFADFFLIASLVWSVADWANSKGRAFLATGCLAFVLLAEISAALSAHDANFFSPASLPSSESPLPPSVDPRLGRIIAVDAVLNDATTHRFLTHAYSTYYNIPSIGGYDPLVGRAQLAFAPGLDYPNLFTGDITPEMRANFEAKAVRYWIVNPNSPQSQELGRAGFRVLDEDQNRIVLEDTQAAPLVYSDSDPAKPCPVDYGGNSILIALDHTASPVEISIGPTDGWWYRIDHGPWQKPVYQNDRLKIEIAPADKLLEVSYFDARFRQGLLFSAGLLLVLGLLLGARRWVLKNSTQ